MTKAGVFALTVAAMALVAGCRTPTVSDPEPERLVFVTLDSAGALEIAGMKLSNDVFSKIMAKAMKQYGSVPVLVRCARGTEPRQLVPVLEILQAKGLSEIRVEFTDRTVEELRPNADALEDIELRTLISQQEDDFTWVPARPADPGTVILQVRLVEVTNVRAFRRQYARFARSPDWVPRDASVRGSLLGCKSGTVLTVDQNRSLLGFLKETPLDAATVLSRPRAACRLGEPAWFSLTPKREPCIRAKPEPANYVMRSPSAAERGHVVRSPRVGMVPTLVSSQTVRLDVTMPVARKDSNDVLSVDIPFGMTCVLVPAQWAELNERAWRSRRVRVAAFLLITPGPLR